MCSDRNWKNSCFRCQFLINYVVLKQKINTIIVAPTRELALQIDRQIEGFSYFTNSSSFPVYGGGTGDDFEAQKKAIKNGADILVCTPWEVFGAYEI